MKNRSVLYGIRPGLLTMGLLTMGLILGGCTVGQRAETLYYRQHRALTALTFAITTAEIHDLDLAERLYDREDELYSACALLLQASTRNEHDQGIEMGLKWRILRSLDTCAQKTREIEHLLKRLNTGAALYYLNSIGHDARGR